MLHRPIILTLFQDLLSVASIIALSYLLTYYFLSGTYLDTGYQDWLYHAYKIHAIQQYGLASWDHIWANGLNHWRAYQYLPHLLTIEYIKYTGFSITQSMIHLTIGTIVVSRIAWYVALRGIGISPFFSLLATILSLTVPQQWQALQDFSIFISTLFLPIYIFFWIKSQTNTAYLILTASLTGISWLLHPLIGLTLTGLFALGLVTQLRQIRFRHLIGISLFFIIAAAAFFYPITDTIGHYANSRFFSMEFIRNMFFTEWLGIGYPIAFILIATFIIRVFVTAPRWATILIIYTGLLMVLYLLAWYGYSPTFLNKTQFTRTNTILGILSTAGIAGILHHILTPQPSRFLWGVLIAYLAIAMSSTIELSSKYGPAIGARTPQPLGTYFQGRPIPQGSIYTTDIGTVSYTNPDFRYTLSYFEHQLPNPLSVRIMQLLRPDRSVSGSSEYDIQLINDYITVLGVEYLFLPRYASLVSSLSSEDPNAPLQFNEFVTTSTGSYAVLQYKKPIHYAYLVPPNSILDESTDPLSQPTADPATFIPWDDQISQLAQTLRQKSIPLPLTFHAPNRLQITLPAQIPTGYQLLITQSYDQNWSIPAHPQLELRPTNLKFIMLEVPSTFAGQTLNLTNQWPTWYWPLHYTSYASVGVALIITLASVIYQSTKPTTQPSQIPNTKY